MASYRDYIINALAKAIFKQYQSGPISQETLIQCLQKLSAQQGDWHTPLAKHLIRHLSPDLSQQQIAQAISNNKGFQTIWSQKKIHIRNYPLISTESPVINQHLYTHTRSLPQFNNPEALATWLHLDLAQLTWFAGLWRTTTQADQTHLQHYRYQQRKKHSTSALRLIEAPKAILKRIQQQIYKHILMPIPCHENTHGFRHKHDVISYTQPHANKQLLIKMDLQDFFPSIHIGRVIGLFQLLGYPYAIARILAGLCTHQTPGYISNSPLYRQSHLPQGAPTSPALSNLIAFNLDCRLSALSKKFHFEYSRYADDLLFSTNQISRKQQHHFIYWVEAIIHNEGFQLQQRKTRIRSQAQAQTACGIIVNQHINIPRREFDNFKALLYNCTRYGSASQNHNKHPDFKAHIQGRLAWFERINPEKSRKLRALFEKIQWSY